MALQLSHGSLPGRQLARPPPLHGCQQGTRLPQSMQIPGQAGLASCCAPPSLGRRLLTPRASFGEALSSLAASEYRDAACCGVSIAGAVLLVRTFKELAARRVIDQNLSRKLVHMSSGPLFALTWPLFSADPAARWLAVCVPLLNFARLLSVGSGVIQDEALVKSVSRSGERSELLKGPLYYCVVLMLVAALCWRENPAGLVVISLMCGGDGLADIVGRRFGQVKLPYNPSKSWAGSAAMLSAGVGMSMGLIYIFCSLGFFPCYSPEAMLPYVVAISLASTLLESLPINQVLDDNISVPLLAFVLGTLFIPQISAC